MKKILIYIVLFVVVLIIVFVFLFKDKKIEINENLPVSESIQEKSIVEKYIRDNVKTIVPEKPVLGGSWYITSIEINPSVKTGMMTYEDGHIQGNKNFSYTINNNEIEINLKEPVACTMDAKQCPDGSYVGRSGPNCEFVCP
jgi:hypothetical protein